MCYTHLVNNNFMTPCAGFVWPILAAQAACSTLPNTTITELKYAVPHCTTPPTLYGRTI